eukprot:2206846-Pyramimonas_sp.AAC.1
MHQKTHCWPAVLLQPYHVHSTSGPGAQSGISRVGTSEYCCTGATGSSLQCPLQSEATARGSCCARRLPPSADQAPVVASLVRSRVGLDMGR